MREELIPPEGAAAELARLDDLARVTRAFAEAGYAKREGVRGLAALPGAVIGGVAGLACLVAPAWGFLLLALVPVALLVGPICLEDRYRSVGEVRPFTFVAPPGPGLLRAGRILAAAVWLVAGADLLLDGKRLLSHPGLPAGLAPVVWGAAFLAVGYLGSRGATSARWLQASILFGCAARVGARLVEGEKPRAIVLGATIGFAILGAFAVADHLHFRKLERRLRALRERG
jgi:hypothetical protein